MTTFSAKDFNSSAYNSHRPTYHPRLYERLFAYHDAHDGCYDAGLDVGTGTGQVAIVLADRFVAVHAIDRSESMLKSAVARPNVRYTAGSAEDLSAFASGSIDMITVAEAIHWFKTDAFFREAHRVLKPQGTLAFWGYTYSIVRGYPTLGKVILQFANGTLGKYWESGRTIMDDLYEGIPVPEDLFDDEQRDIFPRKGTHDEGEPFVEAEMTLEDHCKYIKTWSAYRNYMLDNPDVKDPVDELREELTSSLQIKEDQLLHFLWCTVRVFLTKK